MSYIEICIGNGGASPVVFSKYASESLEAANAPFRARRPNQSVGSFSDIPADERDEFARLLEEAFAGL